MDDGREPDDDPSRERQQNDKLLGAVTAGAAAVFAATAVFVVLTQTLGPALGLTIGAPSDAVLIAMIGSATLGGATATARAFLRRDK